LITRHGQKGKFWRRSWFFVLCFLFGLSAKELEFLAFCFWLFASGS
jgi:hypothetical protein